ncbi:hypothetical protein [Vescimonas sp.]|uniref:hypothetical protein n=1 Tax=Vescimonas sp. TaxID=2892404 RepID=UPI00307CC645
MLRKFIITVICCLSISILCAVPSYAATMSDKEMAIEQISLCWQTSTNKKNVISFDSLTSLCADLNRDGYPCEIRFVSALNGYAILGTGYVHNTFESARVYSLSGKYYSNIEGSIFYSPYQSDSLLSGISTYLSAISSKVSTISDTLTSLYNSLQSWFGGQLSGIYYWTNSINLSASRIDSALTSFFGNNTVSDIISAIPAAPDLSNIESTLSSINNKLDNLPSSSSSAYDDSALLAALQPITSFYEGGVETVAKQSNSGLLNCNLQFERGTFSLLSLDAPADADVFFFSRSAVYYTTVGLSFGSSVRSYSSPSPTHLGPTMVADADSVAVTVKARSDSLVPAGTYDVHFFDSAGNAITLKTGDCFLPGSEVGVWQIQRAEGGYITIGSTTGLPNGFEFSDLFYSCVRFKASELNSAPALFSYWLDYFYNTETYYSLFRIVSSADSTITFRYSTLHPVLAWLAQRQNGFQTWLGNKLDNLPASSGSSDLTSVTTRLDTIIEQLQTTSGESGCDHTYTQDVTQAPTCILPGLQVSTCSQCGDSYSEILAALGHDWQCTSHVEAVTDPDTGEVTQSGYDIYTCSRCGDTYNDYAGDGAPSDYGDTSLSKIIVKLFSKLGTFAGKIISWIIGLFDKMLSGLNDIITRFSDLTAQITGFGGDYPSWLSGFWGILPQEFQLALTFSFVCVFIGVIGRKLFFA